MTGPASSYAELVRPERYPRASAYDPAWLVELDMGPNPLWQLEDLLPGLDLQPGSRVLDLGSGRGATSVFLARECDVDVVAVDLWVDRREAERTFTETGVADRVTAVQADVRALPFDGAEFDAVVSIDAFEYFGTDAHLLPTLLRVLRPGGRIGMSTPALRHDPYDAGIPEHIRRVVGWEAMAWHPPYWWRRHWELTSAVTDVVARWQEGGREDWLRWARATSRTASDPVVAMLEQDLESDDVGIVLVTATKR